MSSPTSNQQQQQQNLQQVPPPPPPPPPPSFTSNNFNQQNLSTFQISSKTSPTSAVNTRQRTRASLSLNTQQQQQQQNVITNNHRHHSLNNGTLLTSTNTILQNGNGNGINQITSTNKFLKNSMEDDVLGQITKEAEAHLAARRQARAEAREIRLREIERQQRNEQLTNMDSDSLENQQHQLISNRLYQQNNHLNNSNHNHNEHFNNHLNSTPINNDYNITSSIRPFRATPIINRESRTSSYASSRRSSQESLEFCGQDPSKELKIPFSELEEKYRKAMISNAQLDNEKQSFVYQIDLYKDEMEELQENFLRLQRDFKEKTRNYEQLKRENERLQFDFNCYKDALEERERLIREADLVIVRNSNNSNTRVTTKLVNRNKLMQNGDIDKSTNATSIVNGNMINGNLNGNDDDAVDDEEEDELPVTLSNNISLISKNAALLLEDIPGKTLEAKLTSMMLEKRNLLNQIKELKNDLDDERNRLNSMNDSISTNSVHLTAEMQQEIQREANKLANDLRYKLKRMEQENAALTSTVSRLENQVSRFKSAADEAERVEEELKLDKRKAQRELREALTKIEELESANVHLQKRIDKLKSNRNILSMISGGTSSSSSNPNTPPIDGSNQLQNPPLNVQQQQQQNQQQQPQQALNHSQSSSSVATSSSFYSDESTLCSNED